MKLETLTQSRFCAGHACRSLILQTFLLHFFKQIFVINSLAKERKKDAFLKIIELEKIQAHELLCIGNSLSSEIKDAVHIGAKSCYFEFGEDRGEVDETFYKKIDYHVKNHFDLIEVCNL